MQMLKFGKPPPKCILMKPLVNKSPNLAMFHNKQKNNVQVKQLTNFCSPLTRTTLSSLVILGARNTSKGPTVLSVWFVRQRLTMNGRSAYMIGGTFTARRSTSLLAVGVL